MNKYVHKFVDFILENKATNTKEKVIELVSNKFEMVKDGRSLYHTDFFAVVFCYSKNNSFSNVIISLSKLQKYDHIPCFVVLVKRNDDNAIYLINTTFINKVSHSSQKLTLQNIRGSILGSNIRKKISEINKNNIPKDFDDLFVYHQTFSPCENLERLVESTNNIKPNISKASFDESEKKYILDSPRRAKEFIKSDDYSILLRDLRDRCDAVKDAILVVSHIENVNIRGRLIEALITSDDGKRAQALRDINNIEQLLPIYETKNDLGDYFRRFQNTDSYTDIKTKILYLDSNPKAYNIDKFLKCMGQNKSVFMFFFIGINDKGILKTILCSVFHGELLKNTILQDHWSGRGTRGTAQFNGKTINKLLTDASFTNSIDLNASTKYLEKLLER